MGGFSLMELLVVLVIAAVLLGVSLPGTQRIYDSMQQRQLVRDVVRTFAAARHEAMYLGTHQDVVFDNDLRTLLYRDKRMRVPADVRIAFSGAAELGSQSRSVVRFYPEGGASGGDIDLSLAGGSGYRISVDWLLGGVTVEPRVYD